jgi:hypothetical protein
MEIEIDVIEQVEEKTSAAEFGMSQAYEGELGEGGVSPDLHSGRRETALRQVDCIIKDMAESYQRTAGVLRTLDRIAGKL